MKVDPKMLNYSSLPGKGECDSCKHKKKGKKAKNGKAVPSYWWDQAFYGEEIDPNDPTKKRRKGSSPYVQSNTFATSGTEDADMQKLSNFDQLSADQQQLMNERYMSGGENRQPKPYQGNTFGGVSMAPFIGGALGLVNNLLPNQLPRRPLSPQTAYNPYAYGTGSQAISRDGGYIPGEDENNTPMAKDGNWIQKAVNPKHKGYCTPMTKKTCTPRRKALARTFKKHHGFHEEGGIIPDPMSAFNPHNYEDGGNVNGGADIREVGASYPNADLMEQWLLYQEGGPVPPPKPKPGQIINARGQVLSPSYNFGSDYRPFSPSGYTSVDTALYDMELQSARNLGPERYMSLTSGYDDMYRNAQSLGDAQRAQELKGMKQRNMNVYDDVFRAPATAMPIYMPKDTIKKKKKDGGTVGASESREVGASYPNSDLLEQWIPWMTGDYRDGGSLSPSKASEMLHDGTANGKKLTAKQKRYFGMIAHRKAAMGDEIDPGKKRTPQDAYYEANARLAHYKDKLNERLKAKNPKAYQDYFSQLAPIRRKGDMEAANKYVQEAKYNEYLTPQEVRKALGEQEYNNYLGAIRSLNQYNISQGKEPLYGNVEGENDVANLNYGRRFASLTVNPSLSVTNKTTGKTYGRNYSYNPNTRNVDYTETGDTTLRPDYLSENSRPIPTIKFDKGGVMYNDGGDVRTLWGGDAEIAAYNPYDGGTIAFNGASHEDGGIGMTYNGNPVEVEGGEFGAKDASGNMNIFGNMNFPGSKTKFKSIARKMAEKEKRYDFLKNRGAQLVHEANPADKYEQLTFNAGQLMMHGGNVGQMDIAKKKQNLSALQKAMLDTAGEFGLDAGDMSRGKIKKARGGTSIPFFQNGGDPNDPTRADRNNNPGNIKYGKFARKYGAKKDKDGFAIFPDRKVGLRAMKELLASKDYGDLPVKDAIYKWTDKHPYRYDLGDINNKKVSDLSYDEFEKVIGTMTKGEGTRYGIQPQIPKRAPDAPPFSPFRIPEKGLTPEPEPNKPGRTVEPPPLQGNFPGDKGPIPSNTEMLNPTQLLGEMYAFATNDVEPVPHFRYDPMLYTPYQMSFQDRLNENQASFSALQRSLGPSNPSALGVLAGQKYQADNAVKADEFRTNQAIANDVTNKNVGILNDAQLKNLYLADTQAVRQSQAKSNTKALNQTIFNSISDKFMKNQYDNRRLAAYENLYDYRFVPGEHGGLQATYYGPDAMFNFDGSTAGRAPSDKKTISRYDQYGNLKGYSEFDDYDLREQQRLLDLEMKKRKLPLLSAPKLQ